jgi:serine protease Do
MIVKTIRLFILSVGVLACICMPAHAVRDQLIYPLPGPETEELVIQWLQHKGYHLRRSAIDSHGVLLYAQKGRRCWQIGLWPHSPLATRVKAAYTVSGTAEPSRLQHLWTMLGDHMKSIMDQAPEEDQAVPAVIVSKTKSVVCIYSGDPEKPLQISGFVIDTKGLIICTAHGLKDLQQPITVALQDGRQLEGKVVKMDRRYDLSLVDVNTDLEVAIALSGGRDLRGGAEHLYNVVCTPNSDSAIFPGTVSGPPRKLNDQLLWQVNMQIQPGSSGSPVFDLDGKLVAVVKGRYRGADTVGFLIPFTSVMKFVGDQSK